LVAPAIALMGARAGLKASKQYSVSVLGYDFIGLSMRLFLFLGIGVLIQAYMSATIQGGNWLNSIAGFFNIKFPSTLPEWLTKLFTTGYKGVAFWQILQISAIILIVFEYMQYDRMLKEKGEKPNASTSALFLLIALALSILVIPETVQKFKEMRILQNG
tara:strand:- start:225 stop:704 length:480 start_codon:yes stop_codon:yes gene_type:complete